MTLRYPVQFIQNMQGLLKEEWQDLLAAWEHPPYQGLRVNTLKTTVNDFLSLTPFQLEPIPWTSDGFYYQGQERPAKHPYYQAGLYYLQEPSAMAPVACLGIVPGDKVLDLCAAPGGKSTQIASALQGEGLLVSNDVSTQRVKTLVWNLERCGVTNAVVTQEEPARLVPHFLEFFDKILVDAPCSGEGMFRRDPRAVSSWSQYHTTSCEALQKEILSQAASMLRKGGRMIYSTCTFTPYENEVVIQRFLETHTDFHLVPLPLAQGWTEGYTLLPGGIDLDTGCSLPSAETSPETSPEASPEASSELKLEPSLSSTRRLWPHRVKGEGHFLALLEKKGGETQKEASNSHEQKAHEQKAQAASGAEGLKILEAFMKDNLRQALPGPFHLEGHYLYQCPSALPEIRGIKVVRRGWFLGRIKNGRFQPSQALAMGLKQEAVQRRLLLTIDDGQAQPYLKGQTLMVEGEKGWTLVCLEGFPLGWGKQSGDYLKNDYPSTWIQQG